MKNNNQKKLVVVLIVIILGLGGFIIYDKVFKNNNVENKDNNNVTVDDSKIEIHNDIDYDNCNLDLNDSVNRFVCYNKPLFYDASLSYLQNDADFLKQYLLFYNNKTDKLCEINEYEENKFRITISKENAKTLIKRYFGREMNISKIVKSNYDFTLQEEESNYYITTSVTDFMYDKYLKFTKYEKILGTNEYNLIFDIIEVNSDNLVGTKIITIKLVGNYYQIKEIS